MYINCAVGMAIASFLSALLCCWLKAEKWQRYWNERQWEALYLKWAADSIFLVALWFDKIPFNDFAKRMYVHLQNKSRGTSPPPSHSTFKTFGLLSVLIVKCTSCNGLCACVRLKVLFNMNRVSISLPHHTQNGYITNWTFLVHVWVSRSLFFSLVKLHFSFALFFLYFISLVLYSLGSYFCSPLHSEYFYIQFFFVFLFISTVSCRSLTVECSLATILAKFVYVFFLCFVHHSLSTFPMRVLFHILNTNTFHRKQREREIHNFFYF